ncbi:MAG: 8-oxo-dGTP diphosphatase [Leptospiraceae bacterium]|nr:8-oxo-dGTP diphosphatase [Leptospiraceae bacterium]MDW8307628.1 8-oxo-dGTP diphosphatase [Leptospiraceae bacterium]
MLGLTLCYIRQNKKTLMLYRNKKENDVHFGKYNGLGGKLKPGESPEEGVKREVEEESGLILEKPRLHGFILFPEYKDNEDWLVFVFTATQFSGVLKDCPEGELVWVDDDELLKIPLWEGDRIFIPWLEKPSFFSAKFIYRDKRLVEHQVHFYPEPNMAQFP